MLSIFGPLEISKFIRLQTLLEEACSLFHPAIATYIAPATRDEYGCK